MRCDACKKEVGSNVQPCECGATFCEDVYSVARPGVSGVVRYKCRELHHCPKGMTTAISALQKAHRRFQRG